MPPKAAGASTRRLWGPEAESRQLGHPQASTMLRKLYIKQGRYKDAEVLHKNKLETASSFPEAKKNLKLSGSGCQQALNVPSASIQ